MTQTITTQAVGSVGSSATARPGGQRRRGHVALWCLQVLAAGVFVMAAIPKVTADPQAVAGFTALGLGTVGMYIIGALELAGAIALLIPRLAGLAGLAFVALMIGAVLSTLLVLGASLVAMPAAVLVLVAVIAWGRRRSTAALIALARRR
ncbi:MAG: DoxX family protein [Pseudonocardiaceae bacterium]